MTDLAQIGNSGFANNQLGPDELGRGLCTFEYAHEVRDKQGAGLPRVLADRRNGRAEIGRGRLKFVPPPGAAWIICVPMKHPSLSRRNFLVGSAGIAAVTIATVLAARRSRRMASGVAGSRSVPGPYGPLRPVADLETGLPLVQLPEGFEYRSFSWSGDPMSDGAPTPDSHDGMGVIFAAQSGDEREIVLVRNHEREHDTLIVAPALYDTAVEGGNLPMGGGTTTLTFRGGRWISAVPSLGGTYDNCAGGVTPWGTWLSCEETKLDRSRQGGRRHGYVFEVRRHAAETTGRPIVDMGRMAHEAVAIDPETRIAYLTEDDDDVRSGGFYRFVPKDPGGNAGSYEEGGQLQAARVIGNRNADLRAPAVGDLYQVEWVDIENPDADPGAAPPEIASATTLASGPFRQAWSQGALRLRRGEGICHHAGKFYVVDTAAGTDMFGRRGRGDGAVWEYDPRTGNLRAIFVADSQEVGDNIDNITASPRGGLFLCEDGDSIVDAYGPGMRLLGLTAEGDSYTFMKNHVQLTEQQITSAGKQIAPGDYRGEELAGVCFDPAGELMFVNIQRPGITLAIWGPWAKGNL